MNSNQTQKPRANHILTILVDLSHPAFASGDASAQYNLITTLAGLAEAVLVGSEATIATDVTGRALGSFNIIQDRDGEGKRAFDQVVDMNRKLQAQDRAQQERQEGRAPVTG